MNIIFDIILVSLLAFGFIHGLRKGLVKILFLTFKKGIALLIAIVFAKPFSKLLQPTILPTIRTTLVNAIKNNVASSDSGAEITQNVPSLLRRIAGLFDVDLTAYGDKAIQGGGDYIQTFADLASTPVSNAISIIMAFVMLYIFARLLLWPACALTDLVFHAPILKQINSVLGGFVSLFFFAIIAWIICEVGIFSISFFPNSPFLSNFSIEKTFIGKFFHEGMLLKWLFSF